MWQEFQAKSLNNHLSIHTGEKSYKYATCAKSFSLVHHLKQHILIHTGEKPCICTKCDSRFSQASSLNTHMRIHTEKKVYKYDICPIKVPDNVPDKVIVQVDLSLVPDQQGCAYYRLASTASLEKVINKLALKLGARPSSIQLRLGGQEVGREQEVRSLGGSQVKAWLSEDCKLYAFLIDYFSCFWTSLNLSDSLGRSLSCAQKCVTSHYPSYF